MKTYIIDTNIVFSTVLNPNSNIGNFVLSADVGKVEFYAPTYLNEEIERHIPRLLELTGQTEAEVRETIGIAYTRINFISDTQIPLGLYSKAARLVRDVDINDVQFVALTEYLNGILWTGDMKLYRHLLSKGYGKVITFAEIQEELNE